MVLSLNHYFAGKKIGYKKVIELAADAGFDALDIGFFDMKTGESPFLGDDYAQLCDELVSLAREKGVFFNQAHAPFGAPYEKYKKESIPHFPRVFDCCERLGIKTLIIHPVQDGVYRGDEKRMHDLSVEFYKSLIPMAREHGVRIATENMWQRDEERNIIDDTCASPEDFSAVIDEVNSEWLVGCVDIGHIVLCGRDPYEYIKKMGKDRVRALHVHDNDLLNDNHIAPFHGKIDWNGVCAALKEIGYDGDFTYEVDRTLSSTPEPVYPDMLKYLESIGRYLIGKIEN